MATTTNHALVAGADNRNEQMKSFVTQHFNLKLMFLACFAAVLLLSIAQFIECRRALDPESISFILATHGELAFEWDSTEAPLNMPTSGTMVTPGGLSSHSDGLVRNIAVDQLLGVIEVNNGFGANAFSLQCRIVGYANKEMSDYAIQLLADGGGSTDGASLVKWAIDDPSSTLLIEIYFSFRQHTITKHVELELHWDGKSFNPIATPTLVKE